MYAQFTGSVNGHSVTVARRPDASGVDALHVTQHDGDDDGMSTVALAVADARRAARLILAMTEEA
jgi:hypothetical protein